MADTYQPYIHDFIGEHVIYRGMYFERSFELPALPDLTGMDLKCQFRKSADDPTVILEFRLDDNSIVISGSAPKILTLKKNADDIKVNASFVYDLVAFTSVEDRIPVMKGIGSIVNTVTR